MKKQKNILSFLSSVIIVILGNMIFSLAIKLFILPANLMSGGTTGIALAITHYIDMNMSLFILLFNIAMLIVGLVLLGRQFAITTIISSVTYPAALEFYNKVLGDMVITEDSLLCVIFAGLGVGIGLSIVIRAGASTGGMDIPPLVLNKYLKIPVSSGLFFFDSIILLMQAFYNPLENILYAILFMIVYSMVIDKVMLLGTSKTEITIVSKKSREIADSILTKVDRGCTILYGEGGYSHEHMHVVFSVVSNREVLKVQKLIRELDPECFLIIKRVTEVRGRGFTFDKHHPAGVPIEEQN